MDGKGMGARTILFPDRLWSQVQNRAKLEGVSASEYVRVCVRGRLTFERALEGDEIGLRILRLTPEELRQIDESRKDA